MKVQLLRYTPDPVEIVVASALLCYGDDPDKCLENAQKPDIRGRLFHELVQSHHGSTVEHPSFTFLITGISRACSHQLVRHRLGSFNQQSQRYVGMRAAETVVPDSIQALGDEAVAVYEQAIKTSFNGYDQMVTSLQKFGRTKEQAQGDARFLLPNACMTNIIWTTNLRNLIYVVQVRLCQRAQWEIRTVMEKVRECISQSNIQGKEMIVQYLCPKCEPQAQGYCDEGSRSCGRQPTKEEILVCWKKNSD